MSSETIKEFIRFKEIMQMKNISVYDIQLSTKLPFNVISKIVEYGEGAIEDINVVMGCLGIKISDCIHEDMIPNQSKLQHSVNIIDLFKQKAVIQQLHPQNTTLVKSFKECSEKRYFVRVHPNKDAEIEEPQEWKLKSKILQTHAWKTPFEAIEEYKEIYTKLTKVAHLYPTPEEVQSIEINYETLELLLEHYNIVFDPFENNQIHKIGKVFPLGYLHNFNSEYLQKVYGICAKIRTSYMRTKIYTEKDYEQGVIDEHIKLLNLYDIPALHQGSNLFEFLVPKDFPISSYYLETNTIFNEWERLKFVVLENVY